MWHVAIFYGDGPVWFQFNAIYIPSCGIDVGFKQCWINRNLSTGFYLSFSFLDDFVYYPICNKSQKQTPTYSEYESNQPQKPNQTKPKRNEPN